MNLFSSSASDPAVKKLLAFKVGDEEEKWVIKAVETLVKKLRKKKGGTGTVEDLEYALAHLGCPSKCVTIPRSLDGRLQVSHRKGLPHVIYCRVWRWPNIASHHELKPVAECLYPYDGRSDQICINPYHYQRVEQSPPLMSPSPPIMTSYQQQLPPVNSGIMTSSPYAPSVSPHSIPPSPASGYGGGGTSLSTHSSMIININSAPDSPQSFIAVSPQAHTSAGSPSILSDDDDCYNQMAIQNGLQMVRTLQNSSAYIEPEYWCTICYYELNSRIGEPFKASSSVVTVDGFTDPTPDDTRICLGRLSNVNRNVIVEKTRSHIGRGVRFTCTDDNVAVYNLSEVPVFIQSRNANFKYNLLPMAVCRVPPNSSMVIFDYQLLNSMLNKARYDGYQHVYELQKMCFIRMSFVKGWGPDYPRKDVTSTPCWIEMKLHKPLSLIDAVLSPMEPPENYAISSFS